VLGRLANDQTCVISHATLLWQYGEREPQWGYERDPLAAARDSPSSSGLPEDAAQSPESLANRLVFESRCLGAGLGRSARSERTQSTENIIEGSPMPQHLLRCATLRFQQSLSQFVFSQGTHSNGCFGAGVK